MHKVWNSRDSDYYGGNMKFLNENTDSETLAYGVAKNESTNSKILAKLAKNKNWKVRIAVARNKNTEPKILAKLAKDERWEVHLAVAKNDNTDMETLAMLEKDSEWTVSEAAKRALGKRSEAK